MKLSVIIVNYNVRYFLQQCLQSVRKAMQGVDGEVWVVDNQSSDGSVEMVSELFPEVHLIANPTNDGFSKANNLAIRKSAGEYVLLLNPDTVVEEETFRKVIGFMDTHADAGGLGVYMIDGTGKFLPESKRGLPTPAVAFYKIFGLSALFPKSKTFGKYHLGYLDNNKTHEVEVLSGAFMLLRRETLEKTGLLDEDYFMYGEDIDLSYKILKAGYKNYYFPETRIIHYKGESTKKSSVNYVFVFYKAMVIFARKHFAPGNAALFSVLINMAIWLRAGAAILQRFIERVWQPLTDALLIFAGMLLLKNYWEYTVKDVHYPPFFMQVVVPVYILIWLLSAYLSGGYDKPVRITRMMRGVLTGTVAILVGYALLPETYRFSRALILLGAAWTIFGTTIFRLALHMSGLRGFRLADTIRKRTIIIGDVEESKRILSLLMLSGTTSNFIGYVNEQPGEADEAMKQYYLGAPSSLEDLIRVYEVNEVIFCGKSIASSDIIAFMLRSKQPDVEYKIAPPESLFIIGSNSMNERGDFYMIDVSNYNKPVNRRSKRIFDLTFSCLLLLTSPVTLMFAKEKSNYFARLLKVLGGRISWIGFPANEEKFKGMKRGVFTPSSVLSTDNNDAAIADRLNTLYAKEYKVVNDLRLTWKALF